MQRTFKLKDKQNVQFRIAGFNFLNHPLAQFYGGAGAPVALSLNYGNPDASVTTLQQAFSAAALTSVNFGYTPYKSGYRIVEVSARYNF